MYELPIEFKHHTDNIGFEPTGYGAMLDRMYYNWYTKNLICKQCLDKYIKNEPILPKCPDCNLS